MSDVKALIITGYGINCEEEMAAAYRLAGAEADIVHLNDIFLKKTSIRNRCGARQANLLYTGLTLFNSVDLVYGKHVPFEKRDGPPVFAGNAVHG